MGGFTRKLLRAVLNRDPSFCDMYEDAPARRVAEEYLRHITAALATPSGRQPLTIVDAGCQAGRLLIPLAQQGHRLIGIDTSAFALRRTRDHARRLGLSVRLHRGDIAQLGRWVPPDSADALICTEVLYLCRNFREILQRLREAVKSGGLLCISHRATSYYLSKTVLNGRPERLEELATRAEGPSTDGDYHNWQTPEQLQQLYREFGLQVQACHPIDVVSTALALPADAPAPVRRILDPIREAHDTFAIPTYYLVIARR